MNATDQPAPVATTPAATAPVATVRRDAALVAAVEVARAAAVEVAGETLGGHLGAQAIAERVVTHTFAAAIPGYAGWHWAVTLARASRSKVVTVDEIVLLPGDDALLAPAWVPWGERLRPGDLGPGDLVPPGPDDPRLVPSYAVGDDGDDDPAVARVSAELGLGRERVMSRAGRLEAAQRWYDSDFGPDSAMAQHAPAHCGTCGFWLPLGGSLRAGFGVCGNDISGADGRVTSAEYGCGAHSQAELTVPPLAAPTGAVFDDGPEITASPATV